MTSNLSRTERFFINAIGWTLFAAATVTACAILGLAIDGLAVRR